MSRLNNIFSIRRLSGLATWILLQKILQTKDAKESYLLGKKVTHNLQLWNDKISKEIMEIGLRAK